MKYRYQVKLSHSLAFKNQTGNLDEYFNYLAEEEKGMAGWLDAVSAKGWELVSAVPVSIDEYRDDGRIIENNVVQYIFRKPVQEEE